MEQLLLFTETKEEKLTREVQELREACDRVRKGQFAKIGQLKKDVTELQRELDILKRGVCLGHLSVSQNHNLFLQAS